MNKLILFTCLLMVGCGYNNAYKDIHDLQAAQADLAAQQANLQQQQAELDAQQEQLEAMQAALEAQVVRLAAGERLVGLLDPCGDLAGQFDEVLLVTSEGRVLAYFESGNKRFLSVLTPNQAYMTTDVQACNFSVDEQGNLN